MDRSSNAVARWSHDWSWHRAVLVKKFRASASILAAWSRGDIDAAVSMYLKLDTLETPAMKEGKEWHKRWENEINKTGCMPKIFGGRKLNKPYYTELKIVVQLAPWLELVGVLDLVELEVLRDWKSGVTVASAHTNSKQHKVYQVLVKMAMQQHPELKLSKPEVFEYHTFNQHNKKPGMARIFLTEKSLKAGVDYIVSEASEMKSYMEDNKLA